MCFAIAFYESSSGGQPYSPAWNSAKTNNSLDLFVPKAHVETSDTRLRNIGCSQSMRKLPAFGVVAVAMSAFGKCGRKTAGLLQNRFR